MAAVPNSDCEDSAKQNEKEYYHRLELASKKVPQDKLMRPNWINMMIDRIEAAEKIIENDSYDNLHPKVKQTLKNYFVSEVTIPDKPHIKEKKLFMKKDGSEGSLEVVPLTKTYPVVLSAHLSTEHGGVNAMSKRLSNSHVVVAGICLSTILEVCQNCLAKKIEDSKNKALLSQKLSGLIDIVKMTMHTNENLDHLLIYQDINTKFLQLRPVSSAELLVSTSNELTHLFSDIGPPEMLVVPLALTNLFTQVIQNLNQIFRPEIKMFSRESMMLEQVGTNLSSKVQSAIEDWLARTEGSKWCVGSFITQWELNNVRDEDRTSPFEKVFGRGGRDNRSSEDARILQSIQRLDINSSNEKGINDFISKNPVLEMPFDH